MRTEFDFSKFQVEFDMALAMSVFTHLPLNHMRLCLAKLGKSMGRGGRFFATIFYCDAIDEWEVPLEHQPGGVISYPERDPYHHRNNDIRWAVDGLPWGFEYIGEWKHPRAQKMLCFTRK